LGLLFDFLTQRSQSIAACMQQRPQLAAAAAAAANKQTNKQNLLKTPTHLEVGRQLG
jgi:hypothetical protein